MAMITAHKCNHSLIIRVTRRSNLGGHVLVLRDALSPMLSDAVEIRKIKGKTGKNILNKNKIGVFYNNVECCLINLT